MAKKGKKTTKKAKTAPKEEAQDENVPKGYKVKKELPPVGDLLAYGAAENAGKKTTFWEDMRFPVFLMVTFFVSMFVFDFFINNYTTHKPFKLPRAAKDMAKKYRINLPKKEKEAEL